MELEGLIRGLAFLEQHAVAIEYLVTDRHPSVRKYMRNGYDFHSTEQGGYMKCRLNGKIFNFIEADGAFWIKMRISAPPGGKPKSSVFSRPGPA